MGLRKDGNSLGRERVAKKAYKAKEPRGSNKSLTPTVAEARRLISIIEKSQVPFGESAPIFSRIKVQVDAGRELSTEDYEHLLGLVKKARDWEKAVESSSQTRPEETLPG
jgi:P2-related tail formation protein